MSISRQPSKSVELSQAAALITDAQRISVVCHINPDADAIGSAAAMALALAKKGKVVQSTFGEDAPVPETLRSIPGADLFVRMGDLNKDADLIITVDCSSLERTGRLMPVLTSASQVLVIDHHGTNTRFGTYDLIDAEAESTTEMLVPLFDELGIELDPSVAEALYSGLMMDTGSFRWGKAQGHRVAARLLDYGFSASDVARRLLDSRPLAGLRLLGKVLANAELVAGEHGAPTMIVGTVGHTDIQDVRREDVEALVDVVRTAEEASITAILKEYEVGEWSVSLRALAPFDVASIARKLNGGGHLYAAGFTFHGSRNELVQLLRDEISLSFGS